MTSKPPQADSLRSADLRVFRMLAGLTAIATPLFGYFHLATNPGAVDSMAVRYVLALVCLLIVALTYVHPRRSLLYVLNCTFYGYTVWALWLLAANRFEPDYAVGAMVVIGAVSVGFPNHRTLGAYLTLMLAGLGLLVLRVQGAPHPHVNGGLYFAYLMLFCAVAFTMLRGRFLLSEKLAASRLRYALAAEGANDGLWDWDVTANRLHLSPRWSEMLGIPHAEPGLGLGRWLERLHPEDRDALETELELQREGRTGHFESEFRIRHQDGGWRWFRARGVAVREASGGVIRMAGSQMDVTAQKAAEEQLLHDAFHDALTGLPNRALFGDRLTQVLHHSMRHRQDTFVLLYLDLDRFKVVNDSLGHQTGDELLRRLAGRLAALLRQEDTVARLGGDEFAVVLPNVGSVQMTRVIHRIHAELARPVRIGSRDLVTTASMGIVTGPGEYTRADDLLRDADIAMYRAKAQGFGRYEVFDDALHKLTRDRLEMEADLRDAAGRGELRLHYQPIISLLSTKVVGFEALVRWEHPSRGLLPPDSFVPLAEETGLIVPIGEWVLMEATRQAARWGGGLTVNVNVSGRQLSHPDFTSHVERALADSQLQAGRLQLEITESVLLCDPDAAIEVLNVLHEMGVQLYLDDFGTGYSSFSYLHRFPIDAVKLDRSFVHRMDEDPRNGAIVRALVAMAQTLGLLVVAEGVERPEEVVQLRGVECPFGQGFLFSRPLASEAAATLAALRLTVGAATIATAPTAAPDPAARRNKKRTGG
jgi:diguanylate cyclase (GGDEF)-like protein/PAS domain S-box-containing protein